MQQTVIDKRDSETGILAEGLRLLGINPAALDLLAKYIGEIERFNPAYGLVKVRDRRELIVKHILDSLTPLGTLSRIIEGGAAVADVGSGAGLPGIPLAIGLPEARFTLIERMGRRAGFLRNCLAALSLSNVTVEEGEMEKSAPGRFGLVVFRAFRPLEAPVLKGLARLLLPGGVIAAYKGRREAIEKELKAAEAAVPEFPFSREIIPLRVPFLDEERHLALIIPPEAVKPACFFSLPAC
jgi:16S rRNA (guanine527-N7)-methyltransferase